MKYAIVRIKQYIGTFLEDCWEIEIDNIDTLDEAQKRMEACMNKEHFWVTRYYPL